MGGLKEPRCHTTINGLIILGPIVWLFLPLLVGAYLIVTALTNPIRASDLGVLGGGFTLTLLIFLFVYLVRPQSILEQKRSEFLHWKPPAQLDRDEEVDHSVEVIGAD